MPPKDVLHRSALVQSKAEHGIVHGLAGSARDELKQKHNFFLHLVCSHGSRAAPAPESFHAGSPRGR
jgi:hypothetical protein